MDEHGLLKAMCDKTEFKLTSSCIEVCTAKFWFFFFFCGRDEVCFESFVPPNEFKRTTWSESSTKIQCSPFIFIDLFSKHT